MYPEMSRRSLAQTGIQVHVHLGCDRDRSHGQESYFFAMGAGPRLTDRIRPRLSKTALKKHFKLQCSAARKYRTSQTYNLQNHGNHSLDLTSAATHETQILIHTRKYT